MRAASSGRLLGLLILALVAVLAPYSNSRWAQAAASEASRHAILFRGNPARTLPLYASVHAAQRKSKARAAAPRGSATRGQRRPAAASVSSGLPRLLVPRSPLERGRWFPNDTATCPSPWTCTDVGGSSPAGSETVSSGTWTVTGGGSGFAPDGVASSDSFYDIWQSVSGNATISARVTSWSPSVYGQAGIIVRQDVSTTDAPYYLLSLHSDNTIHVAYRRYRTWNSSRNFNLACTLPASLEIVRQGVTYTAEVGCNGSSPSLLAGSTVTLAMTDPMSAGIAVTGGTATYDSIVLTPSGGDPALPCPTTLGWTCSDIGSPTVAGHEAAIDGTTWAIDGGGGGFNWAQDGSDNFHLDWQSLPASGAVSAHLFSLVNASPDNGTYASSGLMVRQSSSPWSPFYAVFLGANGTAGVQYRETQNGPIVAASIPSTSATYLRIQRAGAIFSTFTSTDSGATWSLLSGSTVGITMTGAVLAGMFATGGGGAASATGGFEEVSVSPSAGTAITSCLTGWSCTDVGNPQPDLPGLYASDGGQSWAIASNGTGIPSYGSILNGNGGSDQFSYVSKPVESSGTIRARVAFVQNTGVETGIMVRDGTSDTAAFYMISVRSLTDINVVYRQRPNTGASRLGVTSASPQIWPVYLSVSWSGSEFWAAYSRDGTAWTKIPNSVASVGMSSPRGGLAAAVGPTNHQYATFGWDQVSIVTSAGPSPQSRLGGGSPSSKTCSRCTGQPVEDATGDFWHTFADLAVPGRGPALDLSHSYNSQLAGQDSPLGFGWTDSDNLFLSQDGGGTITVHEEGGSEVPFSNTGAGYQGPPWLLATLTQNGDGSYTFKRLQGQEQFVFSAPTQTAAGELLKEVDRNGYTTTLSYNASGQLTSVTDPAGRSLTFAYNAAGRVASVTDPANRTVSFGYDTSGNLTSVTDVGNNTTRFTYDANHLLLTMTDPRGGVVSNVYDSQGRVTSQTDPLNHATRLSYTQNPDGTQTTAVTDPDGYVQDEVYQNNELVSLTTAVGTPQAATWKLTYDPVTIGVSSLTDPNNHVWTNTWDASGNLLSSTDPLNRTTTDTYDALNDLTSVTGPDGITTSLTYDTKGNLLTISRPLTQASQTVSASLAHADSSHPGDVTGVTDPNGHTTSYQHDPSGDLVKETDPLGNVSTYVYDAIGRLTSTVSPKGNASGGNPSAYTTTYTTDPYGEVTGIVDPLGNQTIYAYDPDGNVASVKDGRGNTTSYTYDLDNQLTGIGLPDGSSQGFAYDPNGNLLSQTDGLSRTTSYAYDPLDRVISSTDPLNRKTVYGYDPAGNLTSLADAMSRTTTYSYDAANQLTGITYSDGVTPNVSYAYTADGQRASMSDGMGTSTYSYDSLGRLTQSKNGAGQAVGYGYDLAGNLTSLTYPDNTQVTRVYDAANELTDVKDWNGNDTHFGYDADGNVIREAFPASTKTSATLSYNGDDELTKIVDARSTGSNPFRWVFGYGRDALGQVSSSTDRLPGMRHAYSYDALNRLAGDTRSNRTSTNWTYDAADELAQIKDTASNTSSALSYDPAHELTSVQQTQGSSALQNLTLTYNANGDRTGQTDSVSNTQTTFGYDQVDRLTSFSKGSASASYKYDGDGLRASKTVNGTATAETWDVAEGLPLMVQDGPTKYITGPDGLPIEQVDGSGNIQYYLQDQLGSTRGLIDSSGNLAGQYTFNPYGDVRGHAGVSTPFAYAGQYTDSESGLQYLQARYYDPPTAQFLTVDPLASVTRQTYGYAVGDPLTGSDPSGLACAIGFVPLPCPSDVATFAGQVFASATGLTPAYAPPATDTAGFLNTAPTSFTTPASDATASMLLLLSPGGWEEDALAEGNFVYRGLAEGEDAPCEFGLTARDPQATNDPLSHVAGRQRSQWISTTKSLDVAQTRYGRHGVVRIDLSRVPGRVVDLSNGIPGVPRHYMLSRWAAKQQEVLIQGRVPPGAISRVP